MQKQEKWQAEQAGEKQAPGSARSPMRDSIPGSWDRDLSQRQTLNRLSHPGVPLKLIFVKNCHADFTTMPFNLPTTHNQQSSYFSISLPSLDLFLSPKSLFCFVFFYGESTSWMRHGISLLVLIRISQGISDGNYPLQCPSMRIALRLCLFPICPFTHHIWFVFLLLLLLLSFWDL